MKNMSVRQNKGSSIPWSEKTARQKAGFLGLIFGIFLACTLLAFAAGQLWGQRSGNIPNTKGHTFEMDLTGVNSGIEIVPGTEQSLSGISIQNKSGTENIYAFMSFSYDPDIYTIKDISGWELVENSGTSKVYSYSSGGEMTEVSLNDSAKFTGTLECIADSSSFQSLGDSDFAVGVTGYAISTNICSSGNTAAWTDYQNGGNQ